MKRLLHLQCISSLSSSIIIFLVASLNPRIHILFQLMDLTEIVSHELMNSSVDHHSIFILQYKVWETCLCTELKRS